jgi:hypothetical protein
MIYEVTNQLSIPNYSAASNIKQLVLKIFIDQSAPGPWIERDKDRGKCFYKKETMLLLLIKIRCNFRTVKAGRHHRNVLTALFIGRFSKVSLGHLVNITHICHAEQN